MPVPALNFASEEAPCMAAECWRLLHTLCCYHVSPSVLVTFLSVLKYLASANLSASPFGLKKSRCYVRSMRQLPHSWEADKHESWCPAYAPLPCCICTDVYLPGASARLVPAEVRIVLPMFKVGLPTSAISI